MPESYLIGVAGGSGSGKTTFLKSLLSVFKPDQIALVSQDDYYKPKEQQQKDKNGWINFDLPSAIDRDLFYRDVKRLCDGIAIEKHEYNFNNPEWKPANNFILPAPVTIVEGLFIFYFSEIFEALNYRVFIEATENKRLSRRIVRDREERGYPEVEVQYQWKNHVLPSEVEFLNPFRNDCDLIIDNEISFENGLQKLSHQINNVLHK